MIPARARTPNPVLNRIREVMRAQEQSMRTAARHIGIDQKTAKIQACFSSDLKLSELYAWAKTLEVPAAELLVDQDDSTASPLGIVERSAIIRAAKQAKLLVDYVPDSAAKIIGENILKHLCEAMPEAATVSSDNAVGSRLARDDYGRAACNPVSTRMSADDSGPLDWREACGMG